MSLSRRLLASLTAPLLASLAAAQSFNIDVGPTASTDPLPGYGAAAGQPGTWNWLNSGVTGAAAPLLSLTGGATMATVTIAGGSGSFSFDNVGTVGNDERLMDDLQNVGAAGALTTYTFNGLAAGPYWIYTYAWAPDSAAFRTKVIVAGSPDPDQLVGGAWPGAQRYQITFARHFVFHAGGPLVVTAQSSVGSGSINGLQLVYSWACDGEVLTYCTAQVNSAGCTPALTSLGTPDLNAGAGFLIRANNVLCNQNGILFYGRSGASAAAFHGGTMCVAPPRSRLPMHVSSCPGGMPCGGRFDFDFNAWVLASGEAFSAGDSVWAQVWSRDPAAASTTNLTDALTFTMCP